MIFDIKNRDEFCAAALKVFEHQFNCCEPYRRYVELLGVQVNSFEDIPFMPIEFFKSHKIYGAQVEPEVVFTSSGTTGSETSRHYVALVERYRRSFMEGFRRFYGEPSEYSLFALLPSYMERQGSSLTLMVEQLQACNAEHGGFYLYDFEKLAADFKVARQRGERVLLIGVTFALLDFAESFGCDLSGAVVMETGGMKGRRREIGREELHEILCRAFNVSSIHSEYGMTEMLSQCYSSGGGVFEAPPWVEVSVRSLRNPLERLAYGEGGINVADLANWDSCSFLATGDRGVVYRDGRFEIKGRIALEQLRGCNMLVE